MKLSQRPGKQELIDRNILFQVCNDFSYLVRIYLLRRFILFYTYLMYSVVQRYNRKYFMLYLQTLDKILKTIFKLSSSKGLIVFQDVSDNFNE